MLFLLALEMLVGIRKTGSRLLSYIHQLVSFGAQCLNLLQLETR